MDSEDDGSMDGDGGGSLNESNEERDLREGEWLKSEEKPRLEGAGLGARGSATSVTGIRLRDTERPTFLIELNALDARDLNDFEGLNAGSETEGGSWRVSSCLCRLTFMISMISESSPGPRIVMSGSSYCCCIVLLQLLLGMTIPPLAGSERRNTGESGLEN